MELPGVGVGLGLDAGGTTVCVVPGIDAPIGVFTVVVTAAGLGLGAVLGIGAACFVLEDAEDFEPDVFILIFFG